MKVLLCSVPLSRRVITRQRRHTVCRLWKLLFSFLVEGETSSRPCETTSTRHETRRQSGSSGGRNYQLAASVGGATHGETNPDLHHHGFLIADRWAWPNRPTARPAFSGDNCGILNPVFMENERSGEIYRSGMFTSWSLRKFRSAAAGRRRRDVWVSTGEKPISVSVHQSRTD